jgi:hypothetical protein
VSERESAGAISATDGVVQMHNAVAEPPYVEQVELSADVAGSDRVPPPTRGD